MVIYHAIELTQFFLDLKIFNRESACFNNCFWVGTISSPFRPSNRNLALLVYNQSEA